MFMNFKMSYDTCADYLQGKNIRIAGNGKLNLPVEADKGVSANHESCYRSRSFVGQIMEGCKCLVMRTAQSQQRTQVQMAPKCSICELDGEKSDPIVWCLLCGQLLCKSCARAHKLINATKDHDVIPYDDYKKLPSFIVNTASICSKHREKFTEFCRVHEKPICTTCKKTIHKSCDDVPKIEDIVRNVKDSVLFEDIIIEIETLCKKMKEISDDRNKNLQLLKSIRQEIQMRFEEKFDNIIRQLKKLKEKTITEINTVYNELKNDLSNTSQLVQSYEKELREVLAQKDDIKKFASNYQTFIGLKQMEKMVQDTYTNLNELSKQDKFDKYGMIFQMNKTNEDIVCGIKSLGDTKATKSPADISINITRPSDLEAQKETKNQVPVKLHLQQKFSLEKSNSLGDNFRYCGCCTLPSGFMVFANHGTEKSKIGKVCIYMPDGSKNSTIEYDESEGVYDVTPVDDRHFAVSHPGSGYISIINVGGNRVVKKLKSGWEVNGLCSKGRDIVCCVPSRGLLRINMDSEDVDTMVEDSSLCAYSHVQVSNDLICYTCSFPTHKITVLDSQFNELFSYRDSSILWKPRDVTIDNRRNIFVTGWVRNNLVVFSPNGKSCHQLLCWEFLEGHPTAVHYDSTSKNLVLVNPDRTVSIYSLEYKQ